MSDGQKNWLQTTLPHVKWGLAALLLVLVAGGAMIYLSQSYFDHAQLSRNNEEARLATARKGLASAQEDRLNMDNYTQEYTQMLNRNIIGDEHRLDWIDALEAMRNQNIVMGLKYTIEPQQPYKPTMAIDSGNFELNQSPMDLELDLLHAGQLARFFNVLNNVKGLFILNGCNIQRNSDSQQTEDMSGTVPLLKAQCRGEWLTMKNRNAR